MFWKFQRKKVFKEKRYSKKATKIRWKTHQKGNFEILVSLLYQSIFEDCFSKSVFKHSAKILCKQKVYLWLRGLGNFPANIYLYKGTDRNTRKRCDICFKVNNKNFRTTWRCSGGFTVNFEHISQLFLLFLLLTLNK